MKRASILPAAPAAGALIAGALIAGALTACTVGPDYQRPGTPTPPAFAEAVSTPGTAIARSDADLSSWWTQFSDPELDDLIRRGLAASPSLDAAASRVREARQQERVAAAAELPSLNASGNAVTFHSNRPSSSSGASGGGASGNSGASSALAIPSHLDLYSAGFDASWELDLFGGVRRSIEAAKANTEAAEWTRRDGQVSLVSEIANDYLTLRALQARIALGQAELKRQRDLFGLIRARRENGFTTNLDVNQQTGQVAAAAAQIPQLEAQAKAQVHALGVLIGQPPEALTAELSAVTGLPASPPTLPVGLPSQLLQRRPDIRAAERKLAAANARIGVQEASLFPKVNLMGLAAFANTSLTGLFDSQNFSTIGVGMISEPIFDGGRIRASIRAAREERRQALDDYRTTSLGAFRDVEDALARYTAEETRRVHLETAVSAAQNSLAIAEDQYRVGLVTFINVLQAQNALFNSQDQLTQSRAQSLSDLVSVYKALGGGWSI